MDSDSIMSKMFCMFFVLHLYLQENMCTLRSKMVMQISDNIHHKSSLVHTKQFRGEEQEKKAVHHFF